MASIMMSYHLLGLKIYNTAESLTHDQRNSIIIRLSLISRRFKHPLPVFTPLLPLHSRLPLSQCFRQSTSDAATTISGTATFYRTNSTTTVSAIPCRITRAGGGFPACGSLRRRSRRLGLAVGGARGWSWGWRRRSGLVLDFFEIGGWSPT
jgi:hypothetical protein